MSLKNLAEAVIAQSVEDLWNPIHKRKCIEFFTGEGFRLASEMARMSTVDKLRLVLMLRRCGKKEQKAKKPPQIRLLKEKTI